MAWGVVLVVKIGVIRNCLLNAHRLLWVVVCALWRRT